MQDNCKGRFPIQLTDLGH